MNDADGDLERRINGEQRRRTWWESADALQAFHQRHDRWPRSSSTDPSEPRLSIWLTDQRQARKNHVPRWTEEKDAYLDAVASGWRREAIDSPEARWSRAAKAVGVFRTRYGRWPKMDATDPNERHLGQWLVNQRRARKTNSEWPPERQSALDEHAPGWADERDERWEAQARALGDFYRLHGRWPRQKASPDERRLGIWLTTQRATRKNDPAKWTDLRQDLLDTVAPGWAD